MPVRSRRVTPETLVALLVIPSALVIIAGYALDTAGMRMSPLILAFVAVAGAVAVLA